MDYFEIPILVIIIMRWAGHVACVRENRGEFRVVVGILKKGYHLEHRHIMEDKISKVVQEIGWDGVKWINLAQDRDKW